MKILKQTQTNGKTSHVYRLDELILLKYPYYLKIKLLCVTIGSSLLTNTMFWWVMLIVGELCMCRDLKGSEITLVGEDIFKT